MLVRTVVMSIGIPGSGKTTYLKDLADKYNALYVCPDDNRQLLSGSASNQSVNAEAWELAYYEIGHGLYQGSDVIIDATNTKTIDRKQLIQHCRVAAGMIIGVWFVTPLDICLERNSMRSRVVPEHAIIRMYEQLIDNPPDEKEGFDILLKKN